MPKHFHTDEPLDDLTLVIAQPIVAAVYRFTEFNAGEGEIPMPDFAQMKEVLHAVFLAMVAGNPALPATMTAEEHIEWASELVDHPGVQYLWAANNTFELERLSVEALDDPNWRERQPDPTSDCDENDHYAGLALMGRCPYCGQEEEKVA